MRTHVIRIAGGFAIVFFFSHFLIAQSVIGLGTRYNDSFREWIITTEDEEIRGELSMRWMFKDDWTEWDARIGDSLITIQQKWKGEPDLWEIRCNGITVNARTTWPGDLYRWKLNDGRHQINWAPRYANIHDEWRTPDRTEGGFQVYTYWEGDPREWVVEDELPEDISMAMRVALIFLAVHFSTPRI